jgi:hypothetical protein
MADITITLTDEQAEIIKDEIQGYAEALADDRLNQKKEKERSDRINAFIALPDEEKDAILSQSSAAVSLGLADQKGIVKE